MKNAKWIRFGAAAAALGLVTASSVASAQYNPKREYCRQVALNICSTDANGHPTTPTAECYDEQWQACMTDYARLEMKKPDNYDKRYGQTAARPARLR